MVEGIIYKYTSPSGKVYIGQTTNERHRRNAWFCIKYRYAGTAINAARAKYGADNFRYEVLHKKHYFTQEEATYDLDRWENYYIGYYDSFKNGYNNTVGGCISTRGKARSEEQRRKISRRNKGYKHTPEAIRRMSESKKGKKKSKIAVYNMTVARRKLPYVRQVGQYDASTLELIKVWPCAYNAGMELGICTQNIRRACIKQGKYKGFYWRYFNGAAHTSPKPKPKVVQKALSGEVIAIHDGVLEAAKAMKKAYYQSISACLNGRMKNAYGYTWEYLKE